MDPHRSHGAMPLLIFLLALVGISHASIIPVNSNTITVTASPSSAQPGLNFSLIQNERTRSLRVVCDETSSHNSHLPGGKLLSSASSVISEARLENGSLAHLTSLQALRIDGCKLLELNGGSFMGLRSLQNLTIHTRNVQWGPTMSLSLTHQSLQQLNSLTYLDLGGNNMAHLPPDLFCPLNSLKVLNLTENRLNGFGSLGLISSLGLLCLEELEELDLSHNRLTFVSQTDIASLINLKILKLQGNFIRELAPLALSSLVHLEVIDLSGNQLSRIPRSTFHKSERLQEIYLQNNSISNLATETFRFLNQLRVLNMSANQIASDQFTSFDIFIDLIRLVSLDMSHNKLSSLNGTMFAYQYSLQVLDLSHNFLTSIDDETFSKLYNINRLLLGHNQLTRVSDTLLTSGYVLSHLDLSYNDLNRMDDHALDNCTELRHINLYGNFLTSIPRALAANGLALHHVNLGNNKLSPKALVTDSSKTGLNLSVSVHELVLRENGLTNVSRESFMSLHALKRLDLSHNALTTAGISQNPFDSNPILEAVDLSVNGLSDINSMFPKLERLVRLNVSHNSLSWFDWALVPFSLLDLDLSHNRIEHVGNYFELDREISVRHVDMSYNQIGTFNDLLLPGSVRALNLSHNALAESTLTFYIFSKKVNLSSVDLSYNKFTSFSRQHLMSAAVPGTIQGHWPGSSRLTAFYLAGNPFLCDCNMEWLQKMAVTMVSNDAHHGAHYGGEDPHPVNVVDIEQLLCTPVMGQHHLSTGVVSTRTSPDDKLVSLLNTTNVAPVPLASVQAGNLLCPYKTHCFALCHCCDFDACDCEMTCPDNCSCWSDRTWATNVVDCSAMNHNQVPARVPMDVTELYLDGNYIPILESHALIGRKNMQILRMNASRIAHIDKQAFNGLKMLQVINLNNNELTTLTGHEFDGKSLPSLRELYLSYNRLQTIAPGTFSGLLSLQILHLDHNYLTNMLPWDVLPPPTITHIYQIRLSANPYSCECGLVRQLTSWLIIRSVIVADAYAVSCYHNETAQFALLRDEQEFHPASGQGSRYGVGLTRPVAAIDVSKCTNSGGSVVGGGMSSPPMNGGGKRHYHSSGRDSSMVDNPYPGIASPTSGIPSAGSEHLLSYDQRTMMTPSPTTGSSGAMSSSVFTSQSYLPLALLGTVILVCVFFTGLGLLIYRQELALWFYSRYGVRLGRSASSYGSPSSGSGAGSSRDDEEKLFDAFVSYSKKDEAFVAQMLAPELEYGNPNYRLCLHYRDLPVAAGYLYDAIVEAMEASRRTILIISDNFLESEWCRYGFKSAHHEVLRNARHRLIIVDIGRVAQRELDPEMRSWLRSNTYIQWGEKMFWQKLRYAMPDVPYSSGRKPGDGPLGPGQTLHIYARAR